MKTRILFVDDENVMLQALQRALRPMSNEWEMEFMDSAPQALERMRETPFDIVFSDMRMPVMSGADFLNAVMKEHPQTARFILSGNADPKLIFKCLGSVHQVLSKPCDQTSLKSVVIRTTKLRHSLQSEKIREIVGKMD